MEESDPDRIWRALASPARRRILDVLATQPHTTGELCEQLGRPTTGRGLGRTAVMKHLDLLVAAHLVVVRREGRQRWNYLNPVPIQQVCDRWVSRHVKALASSLARLKDHVEGSSPPRTRRE